MQRVIQCVVLVCTTLFPKDGESPHGLRGRVLQRVLHVMVCQGTCTLNSHKSVLSIVMFNSFGVGSRPLNTKRLVTSLDLRILTSSSIFAQDSSFGVAAGELVHIDR